MCAYKEDLLPPPSENSLSNNRVLAELFHYEEITTTKIDKTAQGTFSAYLSTKQRDLSGKDCNRCSALVTNRKCSTDLCPNKMNRVFCPSSCHCENSIFQKCAVDEGKTKVTSSEGKLCVQASEPLPKGCFVAYVFGVLRKGKPTFGKNYCYPITDRPELGELFFDLEKKGTIARYFREMPNPNCSVESWIICNKSFKNYNILLKVIADRDITQGEIISVPVIQRIKRSEFQKVTEELERNGNKELDYFYECQGYDPTDPTFKWTIPISKTMLEGPGTGSDEEMTDIYFKRLGYLQKFQNDEERKKRKLNKKKPLQPEELVKAETISFNDLEYKKYDVKPEESLDPFQFCPHHMTAKPGISEPFAKSLMPFTPLYHETKHGVNPAAFAVIVKETEIVTKELWRKRYPQLERQHRQLDEEEEACLKNPSSIE